mgnify:FL=1
MVKNLKDQSAEPLVGIFWFYDGQVLFSHAVPVAEGLSYGDAVTGIKDHADYWEELSQEELSQIPAHLRGEYFSIPRGRVVYHKDTGMFCVLHGNNLTKRALQEVRKFFHLPKDRTIFEKDLHYCDYSQDEWDGMIR